jgi:hypothetical protein
MGGSLPATTALRPRADPATGAVEILHYVMVENGGTLVNPMVVERSDPRRYRARDRRLSICMRRQGHMLVTQRCCTSRPYPYTEFGIKGHGEGAWWGPPEDHRCGDQ